MTIQIPDYLLEPMLRRYALLADRGAFDRSDIKTANALRLAHKDVAKIKRMIDRQKQTKDDNQDKLP